MDKKGKLESITGYMYIMYIMYMKLINVLFDQIICDLLLQVLCAFLSLSLLHLFWLYIVYIMAKALKKIRKVEIRMRTVLRTKCKENHIKFFMENNMWDY